MKKIFLMIAAFSLMAFVAVSCDPEDDNVNNSTDSVVPTDTVSPGDTTGGGGIIPIHDTTGPTQSEWVDLGLPSGLLWASSNLATDHTWQNSWVCGDFYAWGEIQTKTNFSWSTYSYCTVDSAGNPTSFTKYNTMESAGSVDGLTTLQASDDAATVALGNGVRTPTHEEWQELIDNTTSYWSTYRDMPGRMIVGRNGNSIFLPAAGYNDAAQYGHNGLYVSGFYMSASLGTQYGPVNVWNCSFTVPDEDTAGSIGMNEYIQRYCGLFVRPVKDASRK